MENLDHLLGDRPLDYLVINHMEPDHGASIEEILIRWPGVKIISTAKAFMLMRQFGFTVDNQELIEVKEGDTFSFGEHNVTFIAAPSRPGGWDGCSQTDGCGGRWRPPSTGCR